VPRYSVVLPTLARADTLEHTLATVLGQTVDDFEVVVQNNGDDAETRELVEGLGDPRVKLFHTDAVVSMVENWERGLLRCTGELITVIGDDDALLPDACEAAGYAIDLTGAEIVSWTPFLYLWPSYWHERRRNRLHADVTFDFVVRTESSRAWLERFYAFQTDYSTLPMLYNSFVKRSLVQRVRDRYGKYFFGSLPDVTSGIINAVESDFFVRSSRPLSIAGISGHSYGHRLSREDQRLSQSEIERHFPDLAQRVDARAGSNLESLVAIEMEVLEEQVLRERCPIHFDRRRLAWAMAATINESPSRYDDTKTAILGLMREFEIDDAELEIPPPVLQPPAPPDGAHLVGPGHVFFVFDGNRIGLTTVADAVDLAAQLVPSAGAISQEQPEARPTSGAAVLTACRARLARLAGRRRSRP
jgi:glycosyltransferase involved in cell wall biosynthesis